MSTSLIYEKGPISADVNWDYTSRYTSVLHHVHRDSGLAGHHRSVLLGDRERSLARFPGLRGLCRRPQPDQRDCPYVPQRQPLLPWAPGQLVGQSASGVGYGYSAYGRSYVAGVSYRF